MSAERNNHDALISQQSFQLKGRIFTLTVFQLQDLNADLLSLQLNELLLKAPKLFKQAPVVLDLTRVEGKQDFSLKSLCLLLQGYHFLPIAIQTETPALAKEAHKCGLAVLRASSKQDKVLSEKELFKKEDARKLASSNKKELQEAALGIHTKVYDTTVRSGQQVINRHGDLIVTGSVSPGAELLSDGNIHVYGILRGKALAGLSGNKAARIFCLGVDAEMLSIAGVYCLSEKIKPYASPCQIFLDGEHIQIGSLA